LALVREGAEILSTSEFVRRTQVNTMTNVLYQDHQPLILGLSLLTQFYKKYRVVSFKVTTRIKNRGKDELLFAQTCYVTNPGTDPVTSTVLDSENVGPLKHVLKDVLAELKDECDIEKTPGVQQLFSLDSYTGQLGETITCPKVLLGSSWGVRSQGTSLDFEWYQRLDWSVLVWDLNDRFKTHGIDNVMTQQGDNLRRVTHLVGRIEKLVESERQEREKVAVLRGTVLKSVEKMRLFRDMALMNVDCAICLEIMVDPVTLICGHSLCQEHVVSLREGRQGKQYRIVCPHCRAETVYQDSLRINVSLRSVILTLQAPLEEEGEFVTVAVSSQAQTLRFVQENRVQESDIMLDDVCQESMVSLPGTSNSG